jgi:hypothetical protein
MLSFKTWKEEFYAEDAQNFVERSDMECVEHSIKKWEGALPENLEKHGKNLNYTSACVYTNAQKLKLEFDSETCALCQKYPENCYTDKNAIYENFLDETKKCPILRETGDTCHHAYRHSVDNPAKMITLLKVVKIKLLDVTTNNSADFRTCTQLELNMWT